MANIIDSLSIELGLDISKFKKSQQDVIAGLKEIEKTNDDVSKSEIDNAKKVTEAEKKATTEKQKAADSEKKTFAQSNKDAKETHVNIKKTADGFDKARDSLIGLSTAFLGLSGLKALSNMVSDTAKNTSELGRQGTLVGVDPKYIQSWGAVGQAAGAAEEDVISSLQNIQSAKANFIITGGSVEAKQGLAYLGLSENDIDKLDIVSEKVKAYIENRKKAGFSATEAIQEAKYFTGNIGYTDATFKMLLLGGDKLRELREEYERLGHITPELIEKSNKFNESTSRLSQSWEGLKNSIVDGVLPEFTLFNNILAKTIGLFADLNDESNKTIEVANNSVFGGLQRIWDKYVSLHPAWRKEASPTAKPSVSGSPITNEDTDFSAIERANGLPAGTLNKVRKIESGGNDFAVSPKGAKGPFQFMDDTAKSYGLSGSDVYDVNKSANAAGKFLGHLLNKYHDMNMALAAYNMGETKFEKRGMGNLPFETQNYIAQANMTGAGINNPINTNNNSTQSTHFNISGVTVSGVKDADGFMNSLQGKVNNTQMVDYGTVGGR